MTVACPGSSGPTPVVCAIIEQNGLMLACRRGLHQTNAGLWEFPGGKVREGESPRAALVREIREELGIDVIPHTQLSPVRHTYPWITIELIPFVCSIEQGTPHPHEHAEVRWVDGDASPTLEWAPADRPVAEEYVAMKLPVNE
ncbi:MAG: (deoxy)nucleoside triphosphate pyrophosphohydrolase [Chitinispirillaceae bacterium]|nr:(deoxy)nucleoside triphosphate pyrophosphohydrolase [Chitinispirillaceae bacterium]